MLKIGSLVDGKYRVLRKCGQGGMSIVYMAMNERANKTWAIKEIRKSGIRNYEVIKQGLLTESDLLKRLNHPNLPSIIDVIDGKDSLLIVMDFIEGRTLQAILEEYGAQPQKNVIEWAKQLCDVLGYLHSRTPPIIYRDMKPSNIMLKPDGNVVLFDFGTAREYKSRGFEDTVCLGTRGYAAPEQYGGRGQTDARTDIYCLGMTLYHLLTGHNPGDPPYECYPIRQWNPELSKGLETILLKCTAQNPKDRYQSCGELYYALGHFWEADADYRKSQKSSLKKFAVPALLTVFFGAASGVFYGLELYSRNHSYAAYLHAAENSAEKEEEIANYRKAINLDPCRKEGYEGLLQEAFLDDNVLTATESRLLREVLIDYGDGKRMNEAGFVTNRKGYETFAYEAGIAYYYKFEEKSNKKNAKGYFDIARNSEYLEEKCKKRAERLYKISDYYSMIGVTDVTGDINVSYREYWDDLTALAAGNLVEEDNERTALILYQELTAQILSSASEFRRDGVTEEEMRAQLINIRKHLRTDFKNLSESRKTMIKEELAELWVSINRAEKMISSAFVSNRKGGKNGG